MSAPVYAYSQNNVSFAASATEPHSLTAAASKYRIEQAVSMLFVYYSVNEFSCCHTIASMIFDF